MKKIKIYGDSILKGVMFNEELNRYKLFGYRFDELSDNGIEVENNCKMGATIGQGFEIMKDTLDDCNEDTVVVLEYGGNDCNFDWSQVANDPEGEYYPNTPADKFEETYVKMIDFAREKGARVAVCNLVPIDSDKFMNWVSKGLNYNNILYWLGDDVNRISRWQEYYSRIIEKIAIKAKCPILDLRTNFLTRSIKNMIGVDGMHPSADGHSLIKDTLQKSILTAAV